MATIKQLLSLAEAQLQSSDSGRLDAELLLAHATEHPREYLFTWPERDIAAPAQEKFESYCARRAQGEPVAYIVGRQAFWDFELAVSPAVLIPRPETELLVETAIEILGPSDSAAIADLGTGSGAIAIALAAQRSGWQLTAVDSSAAALAVAESNAASLNLRNIEFREASWCDGLQPKHFDLVAANPPYVQAGDPHLTEGSLPFEPITALVAEQEGLADITIISEQARACLKRGGWLLIEHGFEQRESVRSILRNAGYENIECRQDLAGLDRLTRAQYNG